ncbi:ARM repeat superfamily protein [Trifolium repens]|nr:ARM repeat superfamily protein [Trifolium repens]
MRVSADKSYISNSINPTNFQGGLDSRKVGQNRRVINEVCEKKQADPGHRPITRRFAAKIVAGTQKSNAEGTTKRSNLGISNGLTVEDQPVPMALEQIEPMLVGSDQMGFSERLVTASRPAIGNMFKRISQRMENCCNDPPGVVVRWLMNAWWAVEPVAG